MNAHMKFNEGTRRMDSATNAAPGKVLNLGGTNITAVEEIE